MADRVMQWIAAPYAVDHYDTASNPLIDDKELHRAFTPDATGAAPIDQLASAPSAQLGDILPTLVERTKMEHCSKWAGGQAVTAALLARGDSALLATWLRMPCTVATAGLAADALIRSHRDAAIVYQALGPADQVLAACYADVGRMVVRADTAAFAGVSLLNAKSITKGINYTLGAIDIVPGTAAIPCDSRLPDQSTTVLANSDTGDCGQTLNISCKSLSPAHKSYAAETNFAPNDIEVARQVCAAVTQMACLMDGGQAVNLNEAFKSALLRQPDNSRTILLGNSVLQRVAQDLRELALQNLQGNSDDPLARLVLQSTLAIGWDGVGFAATSAIQHALSDEDSAATTWFLRAAAALPFGVAHGARTHGLSGTQLAQLYDRVLREDNCHLHASMQPLVYSLIATARLVDALPVKVQEARGADLTSCVIEVWTRGFMQEIDALPCECIHSDFAGRSTDNTTDSFNAAAVALVYGQAQCYPLVHGTPAKREHLSAAYAIGLSLERPAGAMELKGNTTVDPELFRLVGTQYPPGFDVSRVRQDAYLRALHAGETRALQSPATYCVPGATSGAAALAAMALVAALCACILMCGRRALGTRARLDPVPRTIRPRCRSPITVISD